MPFKLGGHGQQGFGQGGGHGQQGFGQGGGHGKQGFGQGGHGQHGFGQDGHGQQGFGVGGGHGQSSGHGFTHGQQGGGHVRQSSIYFTTVNKQPKQNTHLPFRSKQTYFIGNENRSTNSSLIPHSLFPAEEG